MLNIVIRYRGLEFTLIPEDIEVLEEEANRLKRQGVCFDDGEIPEDKVRIDGKVYSLDSVAEILSEPLRFGDKSQINALRVFEAFRLMFNMYGEEHPLYKHLKKQQ